MERDRTVISTLENGAQVLGADFHLGTSSGPNIRASTVVTLEKMQKTTVIGGQRPPAPFGTSRRPLGTTIHHSGGIGATFEVFHLFGVFSKIWRSYMAAAW